MKEEEQQRLERRRSDPFSRALSLNHLNQNPEISKHQNPTQKSNNEASLFLH
jgi:hypothetical protein